MAADKLRLMEQQEYEGAIGLLREVTAAAPDVVAPHIDLGIAYGHVGDLESAEASCTAVTEIPCATASPVRSPVADTEACRG